MTKDPIRLVLCDVDRRIITIVETNASRAPNNLAVPMLRKRGNELTTDLTHAVELYHIQFALMDQPRTGFYRYVAERKLDPHELRVFLEQGSRTTGASINYQDVIDKATVGLSTAISAANLVAKQLFESLDDLDPIAELRRNESKKEAHDRDSAVMDLMIDTWKG